MLYHSLVLSSGVNFPLIFFCPVPSFSSQPFYNPLSSVCHKFTPSFSSFVFSRSLPFSSCFIPFQPPPLPQSLQPSVFSLSLSSFLPISSPLPPPQSSTLPSLPPSYPVLCSPFKALNPKVGPLPSLLLIYAYSGNSYPPPSSRPIPDLLYLVLFLLFCLCPPPHQFISHLSSSTQVLLSPIPLLSIILSSTFAPPDIYLSTHFVTHSSNHQYSTYLATVPLIRTLSFLSYPIRPPPTHTPSHPPSHPPR